MSADTTIHSKQATQCPACKQPNFSFVLHVEGSRCTDCHVSITTGTRPLHVAAAGWKSVSVELRIFDTPKVELHKRGKPRR